MTETIAASSLDLIRHQLAEQNLDGLFITRPENRAYLSNFSGSFGYLLITHTTAQLFTDGRYTEQAQQQATGWQVTEIKRPFHTGVTPALEGIKRLGFEADGLNFSEYQFWSGAVAEVEWVATNGITARLRQRKTLEEVIAIRRAIDIAEQAFNQILTRLKPGMSERDAAAELEYAMRRYGADAIAFDTIVASGWRGALPHGRASDKLIEAGELVTFDFGARWDGYNSDITRTIFVGGGTVQPTDRQHQVYNLVLEAQLAGIAAVKPGAIAREVDAVARDLFANAGELDNYLHSTGHNLGREVHETPFINMTDSSVLETGMVLTVEPGLYYPGWGGVRIEDDVLVTTTGCEVLPTIPKNLLII